MKFTKYVLPAVSTLLFSAQSLAGGYLQRMPDGSISGPSGYSQRMPDGSFSTPGGGYMQRMPDGSYSY
jgi:hypothetical protein